MLPETYFADELVPKQFPSKAWLERKLRAGAIPGSKVGRKWVMTEMDVRDALEILRNTFGKSPARLSPPPSTRGLTGGSARRHGMRADGTWPDTK
jgi:hypothetical protein